MKGDFSRDTFDKLKHYSGVLMQQGRVQLDADWNEQASITRHHSDTRGGDIVGRCGTRSDDPGFEVMFSGSKGFGIGKGRYYADGMLCENEEGVTYKLQPDLPDPPEIPELLKKHKAVAGLIYLEVWQRHITALDDRQLRETALGGPDTATRVKTVWQAKVLPLPSVAVKKPNSLAQKVAKRKQLEAELQEILPSGHFSDLERCRSSLAELEQEIADLAPDATCGKPFPEWEDLIAPSTGTLNARTAQPPKNAGPCALPPLAGYQRLENQLYRVEVHTGGTRDEATFKWSRDNGSVVTAIKSVDGNDLTVADVGKDEVLGFAADQWVEIIDDFTELNGLPGELVKVVDVNSTSNVIRVTAAPATIDTSMHPKLRRWDQAGASATPSAVKMRDGWLPLEDGIEVSFAEGTYKTGDYWLIPGRTATGEIEWPPYEVPNTNPIPQPALGIKRHFCPLALFFFNRDDSKLYRLRDCRRAFPPITQLTSLFCVSGDGQEAMPDLADRKRLIPLKAPLRIGVAAGQWPVKGARLRFEVVEGKGTLKHGTQSGKVLEPVITSADGVAECRWEVDGSTSLQQVRVTLLDAAGQPAHLPVYFNASPSVANEVAYDPEDCTKLADVYTVQDAIDKLCRLERSTGCAVSVAPSEDLNRVLNSLIEKGETDICICLMPGKHKLPEGLKVGVKSEAGVHVTVMGCGRGTRIRLEKLWEINSMTSFTLRGAELSFVAEGDPLMSFRSCDEVTLQSCVISGVMAAGFLLAFTGGKRVRVTDTTISAYQQTRFKTPVVVLREVDEDLSSVFKEVESREFKVSTIKVSSSLSGLSKTKRRDLARRIRTSVEAEGAKLSNAEKTEYIELAKNLEASSVSEKTLADRLSSIRDMTALQAPGNALLITNGDADVLLQDNDITGLVSFYGVHTKLAFTADDLRNLRQLIKQKIDVATRTSGRLVVQGNRLGRMVVADTMIKKIKAIIKAKKGNVEGVFMVAHLTDNVFTGPNSHFISEQLGLTSNLFVAGEEAAGVAVAHGATLVGNQAADRTTLHVPSRGREAAANLNIEIG
jgi:hypothetical protein